MSQPAKHDCRNARSSVVTTAISGAVIGAALAIRKLRRLRSGDPTLFEPQVREQERAYAEGYPQGAVLLTGSSFFEMWTTSAEDLAPLETINIGIGGTRAGDHIHFFRRMVVPFHPKVLVVYVGSNDINGIPFLTKSAAKTAILVVDYLRTVRQLLPAARIYYVAITEAPARVRVRGEIQRANHLIAAQANTVGFTFIDTSPALLRPDGTIDSSLFGADTLHFNASGYVRFASAVCAGLANEFAKPE